MAELAFTVDRTAFEQLVAAAVNALPDQFRANLENVEVVVEDWPDRDTLRQLGIRQRAQLLGFYHGVPRLVRTHNYGLVLPDKISIYRYPILLQCRTLAELQQLVQRVVRHEIAHHFGIDDDRLHELGAY